MADEAAPTTVDVYWRPGCPYCERLFRSFEAAGVVTTLHNIWEDDDARNFVQSHNRGNETVPTVAIGEVVVTNPEPGALIDALRNRYPRLLAEASAGTDRN